MNDRTEKLLEQVRVNEQIERIAEQAGCKIDRLGYGEGNLEEFAKLIVQECTELTLDYKSDQYYNGWIDYRDEIKKHFGVEE